MKTKIVYGTRNLLCAIAVIFALALALATTACGGDDDADVVVPVPHTHSYSNTWSFDATQHWHECTANDGAKGDVANHTAGSTCTDCGYDSTAANIVTFSSLTANGNATTTTTTLTLTFSAAINGLSATDITLNGVAGVQKGALSGTGPTYTLGISGFTAGGTLTVAVAKTSYNISGSPKQVTIYYYTSGGGPIPPLPPVSYEMVYVPGGSFQMGKELNPGSGYSDVTPVHTVTLSAFYMGKYEVTQELYQSVTGNNPSEFSGSNRPVEMVSWYDAVEFANKLSEREGLQPVYTISGRTPATGYPITSATVTPDWNRNGYRLPTEAQWEYAAKGGNGSPGNYTYAGSNNVGDVAWYSSNSGSTTHAVGTKAPNGLDLYDMSGNVLEWCWDWDGVYSSEAQTDPVGASSGSYRVFRGGSWSHPAQFARSASRLNSEPYYRYNGLGFRVLRP